MLIKKPGSKNWIFKTMVNGKTWERSTGTANKRDAERKAKELARLAQVHRRPQLDCLTWTIAAVHEVDRIETEISSGEAEL